MTERVIDASALVFCLIGCGETADLLRRRSRAARWHSPHLIDAEVGNVLRAHERAGLIGQEEASVALRMGPGLVTYRYSHQGSLAERAWELRHNLSFYDALYVALAASLALPLLTTDHRLTRAPQLPCEVELLSG